MGMLCPTTHDRGLAVCHEPSSPAAARAQKCLCFSLFSLFSVCTSHSELRTYSNEVCCCTAVNHTNYLVYHTKYHTWYSSIISYQVSYSIIIHSRSGVTDVGLLYHTRSLAVRVLSLSSFLDSRTLSLVLSLLLPLLSVFCMYVSF